MKATHNLAGRFLIAIDKVASPLITVAMADLLFYFQKLSPGSAR
jgi:hypothetical protein